MQDTYSKDIVEVANRSRRVKTAMAKTGESINALRRDVFRLAASINKIVRGRGLFRLMRESVHVLYPDNPLGLNLWTEKQFHGYQEWSEALRCEAGGITEAQFLKHPCWVMAKLMYLKQEPKSVASPFTAAFKNPLPKRKPDGRTTEARLDILDAEKTLADPKQRPVAFMARDHDDEPRVTPTKQERAYDTQKELEQELARAYATIAAMKKTDAAKDRLIAAQADEITALRAKLKGRAA